MIIVDPMPDELAAGHEARRMTILGCDSQSEHLRLMKADLAFYGKAVEDLPRLHLLAMTADVEAAQYAQSHSMLASLRVVARIREAVLHGSPEAATFSRRLGMAIQRVGAYVCNDCIDGDLAHFGFSWYRRTHHLAGFDWCPIHGGALSEISSAHAFASMPHRQREQGRVRPLTPFSPRMPEQGLVRRYMDVARGLMKRDRPLEKGALQTILSRRAKVLGLAVAPNEAGPRTSDRLMEHVDPVWLDRAISMAVAKRRGVYFGPIDNATSGAGGNVAGIGYSLALSALYGSAGAALSAVAEAADNVGERQSAKQAYGRSPKSQRRAYPPTGHTGR